MKKCIKCNHFKDISEFPKRKRTKDGTRNECKQCYSSRLSKWAKNNNYKHQDKYLERKAKGIILEKPNISESEQIKKEQHYRREYYIKSYGLLLDQYDSLLSDQEYSCAICKKPFNTTPCIDHCHKTNTVRGLLCRKCNLMLGLAKDNPDIFNNAMEYLNDACI